MYAVLPQHYAHPQQHLSLQLLLLLLLHHCCFQCHLAPLQLLLAWPYDGEQLTALAPKACHHPYLSHRQSQSPYRHLLLQQHHCGVQQGPLACQ
jgi:hypothetical protein